MTTKIQIDLQYALEPSRRIALIWSIDDVREICPDLTDDQCWDVLQEVECQFDPAIGITRDTFKFVANDLFELTPLRGAGWDVLRELDRVYAMMGVTRGTAESGGLTHSKNGGDNAE